MRSDTSPVSNSIETLVLTISNEDPRLLLSVAVVLVVFFSLFLLSRSALYRFTIINRQNQSKWQQAASDYLPLRSITHYITRTSQLIVLSGGFIILLYVWGYEFAVWYLVDAAVATWPIISRTIGTGLLLLAAYAGLISVDSWISSLTPNTRRIGPHDKEIIKRVLQMMILLIAVLFILTLWEFDLSGLLLGAGAIGVILGFAARETLGSVIAGFVLMFSRPFEIGDWIVVGDDRGIVTDITIAHTRIRGPNGEHVIIPNEVIGNQTVRNRSQENRLRFSVTVGVDYNADIEAARQVAQKAVESVDIVEETPFPSVRVEQLDDSSVLLRVRFWVEKPNTEKMWKAEDDVLEAVKKALEDAEINIPYPHRRHVTEEK